MRARMKPNDRTNISLSPIPLAVSKIILHLHFCSFLLVSPDFFFLYKIWVIRTLCFDSIIQ